MPTRPITALTLVEILAVVVILGLLAATLTVGISAKMGKAKKELAKTQIAQVVAQVQIFQLDTRNLPTSAKGLAALSADPAAACRGSQSSDANQPRATPVRGRRASRRWW